MEYALWQHLREKSAKCGSEKLTTKKIDDYYFLWQLQQKLLVVRFDHLLGV